MQFYSVFKRILIGAAIVLQGPSLWAQNYIGFTAAALGPSGSGPSTGNQAVTFGNVGGTIYSPATTVTFSLSNQQFSSVEGIPAQAGVVFGATGSNSNAPVAPLSFFLSFNNAAPTADFTPCNNGCTTTTDPNFANNTYGMELLLISDALINAAGANTVPNNSRVQFADLTLTFSRPVYQPIIHLSDLGGFVQVAGTTMGMTTDLDLVTSGLTMSKLSGSTYFSLDPTNTKIFNSAAAFGNSISGSAPSGGYLAGGSVRINSAVPISSLTFRLYLHGDGRNAATARWATTSNTSGDAFLMSVGLDKVALSGHVYNDANGLTDNTVNGTPMATASGNQLYANLVGPDGIVVATMPVATDGTYAFSDVLAGVAYAVQLTTVPGTVNASFPATTLPSGWVYTGEFVGAGAGTDGNPNGAVLTPVVLGNVSNINFGIEQLSTAQAKTQTIAQPAARAIPAGSVTTAVGGTDPEDGSLGNGSTVVITNLPAGTTTMYYDFGSGPVAVVTGQVIAAFDPSKLSFTNIPAGSTSLEFGYAFKDAADRTGSSAVYNINWPTPLPVNLLGFSANTLNCMVALQWQTGAESEIRHYELQRSNDGRNYVPVIVVQPKGSHSSYGYTDYDAYKGRNLYRLAIEGLDGQIMYSSVVATQVSCSDIGALSVYPNPVKHMLTIEGLAPGAQVEIYNTLGQLMDTHKVTAATFNCSLEAYARGTYILLVYRKDRPVKGCQCSALTIEESPLIIFLYPQNLVIGQVVFNSLKRVVFTCNFIFGGIYYFIRLRKCKMNITRQGKYQDKKPFCFHVSDVSAIFEYWTLHGALLNGKRINFLVIFEESKSHKDQ